MVSAPPTGPAPSVAVEEDLLAATCSARCRETLPVLTINGLRLVEGQRLHTVCALAVDLGTSTVVMQRSRRGWLIQMGQQSGMVDVAHCRGVTEADILGELVTDPGERLMLSLGVQVVVRGVVCASVDGQRRWFRLQYHPRTATTDGSEGVLGISVLTEELAPSSTFQDDHR